MRGWLSPTSPSKIGFLAYSNMTLPPVQDMTTDPMLFTELEPIDIDPNHGVDDPRSPQKQAFREILNKWAKVTQGRLTIYDYDQSMLVWRDLPNPSQMAFREDVKHYRDAGILGVNTESRNALATTFTNLYLRARLLWNPEDDVNSLLDDFYPLGRPTGIRSSRLGKTRLSPSPNILRLPRFIRLMSSKNWGPICARPRRRSSNWTPETAICREMNSITSNACALCVSATPCFNPICRWLGQRRRMSISPRRSTRESAVCGRATN